MITRKVLNKRILLQAFLAFTFDLGGILSGRIALVFSPLFASAPWILALFPPLLSVRGDIGGIFAGKLGTMLHLGEAEPKIRGNTREFYSFIKSIFFLTFTDTIGIGIVAFIINLVLGNASYEHLLLFIAVPPISCLLTMVLVIPIGTLLGIIVFRRGLDPDIIVYPAMSTIDDAVITICYVFVVNLALIPSALLSMSISLLLLGLFFFALSMRCRGDSTFRRTLREGIPMVLLSSVIGTFGGIGLVSIREEIEKKPSILMLYPALIDTLGDIGSILGAQATTKLALKQISSFWETLRDGVTDLISVEVAAACMHVLFGLAAFLLGKATGLTPDLFLLVNIALIANLISFLFIALLSFAVATQTFKYRLDPDNFVIPLVTSIADFGATLALITALRILNV